MCEKINAYGVVGCEDAEDEREGLMRMGMICAHGRTA